MKSEKNPEINMNILLNLMEMYDSLILFINIPSLTESEHSQTP